MKIPFLKRAHLAIGLIFAPQGFYQFLHDVQIAGRVDGFVNVQQNLNRERRRKLAKRRKSRAI